MREEQGLAGEEQRLVGEAISFADEFWLSIGERIAKSGDRYGCSDVFESFGAEDFEVIA